MQIRRTIRSARVTQQIIWRNATDFDLQIDTIEQWSAQAIQVRPHLAIPAATRDAIVPQVATSASITSATGVAGIKAPGRR